MVLIGLVDVLDHAPALGSEFVQFVDYGCVWTSQPHDLVFELHWFSKKRSLVNESHRGPESTRKTGQRDDFKNLSKRPNGLPVQKIFHRLAFRHPLALHR